MTTSQGEFAALSRYIFRAPRWHASVTFSLLIAAIAGIGAFDSTFVLDDAYRGVFYVGVPTLIACFATAPIDRWLGGHLTYNRSSLLALTCEVIVIAWLSVAAVISALTPLGQGFVTDALLAALAFIFAFRLVVVMAVSHRNPVIAAVPAGVQTATAAVLLFVYSGTLRFFEIGGPIVEAYLSRPEKAPAELLVIVPEDFLLLGVMCLLYSTAAVGLVYLVDRPWRRSLGVSGLDLLRGFIGHVAEGSRELEEFFERIGEEAIVPVSVLSFRRRDGTEKARFVLPMIHPGPMGEIGGGNLPERVAEEAAGLAFPPHATAGHDFNLVTEHELEAVLEAAARAHRGIEYHGTASRSVRVEAGAATVLGQALGDDLLLVATFAPAPTDDIMFGVGSAAIAEAAAAIDGEVLLVDAHNCNDGIAGRADLGHVTAGSQRAHDLRTAVRRASRTLASEPQSPLLVGTAWERGPWGPEDGIGALGFRVAVTAVGDQRTAYVLIDGNNMEPQLRDRILEHIDAVDNLEVMTTDNHAVTRVDPENQVGSSIPTAALLDLIDDLVGRAIDDLEPVDGGVASEDTRVIVFGNDRTETLASHANAVVALGAPLAALVVLVATGISILVFFLT